LKIGLQSCASHKVKTPCLWVPTVPHTTDDNWPNETAISSFPVVAWGKTEKVSRRGWCWFQRYDRSFLRQSLLGRKAISAMVQFRLDGWPHAHLVGGRKSMERRESGGSGGNAATHNNKPFLKHLPVFPPFLSRQCWRSILGGDGDMPSSKPIDNEWPIKPTLPTSRASNHLHSGRTYQVRDLRSV